MHISGRQENYEDSHADIRSLIQSLSEEEAGRWMELHHSILSGLERGDNDLDIGSKESEKSDVYKITCWRGVRR